MPIYTYDNYNYPLCTINIKYWYKNNKRHRNGDLPAIDCTNDCKEWYKSGKLHRNGGLPAIEDVDGNKFWYKNGKCQRDDNLPAIDCGNGDKKWYKNNKRYFPLIYSITITINKIIKIKIEKL